MKKILAALGIILLSSTISTAAVLTGIIVWGYDGIERAKMWVSPDGRMSLANNLDNMPTAWDLWPTLGQKPKDHAISEITLHRCGWWEDCVERISFATKSKSIANDGTIIPDHYRISIENGGTGRKLPLWICFEKKNIGDPPDCPLKIDPTAGVIIK